MKFVRGFKTDCERTVSYLRDELGVQDDEPIDMHELADHLLIPVHAFSEFVCAAGHTRDSATVSEIYAKVSAFTVFDGPTRRIIFNENHAPARHRSNMGHELAHALLHHPARGSGIGVQQEKLHEDEAAWLAGVLMLTAAQARKIAVSRMTYPAALAKYKLSLEMLRYRLNVTGASRLAL